MVLQPIPHGNYAVILIVTQIEKPKNKQRCIGFPRIKIDHLAKYINAAILIEKKKSKKPTPSMLRKSF